MTDAICGASCWFGRGIREHFSLLGGAAQGFLRAWIDLNLVGIFVPSILLSVLSVPAYVAEHV
jgi:hypothetical protein